MITGLGLKDRLYWPEEAGNRRLFRKGFASFGYAYYADGALAEAADTVGSTSRSYE